MMEQMRFSRHARNQMQLYRLTEEDAELVRADPISTDTDPDGRSRFVGIVDGRRVRLVLAVDDPDLVVTFHERSK